MYQVGTRARDSLPPSRLNLGAVFPADLLAASTLLEPQSRFGGKPHYTISKYCVPKTGLRSGKGSSSTRLPPAPPAKPAAVHIAGAIVHVVVSPEDALGAEAARTSAGRRREVPTGVLWGGAIVDGTKYCQ